MATGKANKSNKLNEGKISISGDANESRQKKALRKNANKHSFKKVGGAWCGDAPVIPVFRGLKEDLQFRDSLGYLARLCLRKKEAKGQTDERKQKRFLFNSNVIFSQNDMESFKM